MNAQDRYNSERYPDMTCFLALRNIERNERKERRSRMKENWIYRRGDVYLANLDPYIGKALAFDQIFQAIHNSPLHFISVMAIDFRGVKSPGKEKAKRVQQSNIPHSGLCTGSADQHGPFRVAALTLGRNVIGALTRLPAWLTEDYCVTDLQAASRRI